MFKGWANWSLILIVICAIFFSYPSYSVRNAEFGSQNNIYLTEWSRLKHKAELGDPDALFILGNYYFKPPRGSHFKKNLKKSAKYYFESGIRGNAAAQYNFAFMLLQGLGVTADPFESFVWFKLAASSQSEVDKHVIKLSKSALLGLKDTIDEKDIKRVDEQVNYYKNIIAKKNYRKSKYPGK